MMKILCLLLVCCSVSASAQEESPTDGMVLKNYQYFKRGMGDGFVSYIQGAGQSLEFTTGLLKHRGQRMLFCPPDNLGLNAHNFLAIADQEVTRTKLPPNTPIVAILLAGLVRTFPCQ